MAEKTQISILCGGQSSEHAVSLDSAANVVAALDKTRFAPTVIYIDQAGSWYKVKSWQAFLEQTMNHLLQNDGVLPITVAFGNRTKPWLVFETQECLAVDCVLPMIHGHNGEDGALQGLLELLNVPYVGAGVLGSAIAMDKAVMKRLLQQARIPTAAWHTLHFNENRTGLYERLANTLGSILFVKPANTGSSIGVARVENATQFADALLDAFQYDEQVIIEEAINGREIECAVLGNEKVSTSLLGEIVLKEGFYSYAAKYLDSGMASTRLVTDLAPSVMEDIRNLAKEVFNVLCCRGMLRVDFFLVDDEKIVVNEANTIPGFTNISMYPKLWEASGLQYSALLTRLIGLALASKEQQQALRFNYQSSRKNETA